MALFIFTKAITEGKKIDVFNYGMMSRDFTYIDDIVEGITRLVPKAPESGDSNALGTKAPYRLFNIGYRSEEHTSELQSRGHLVCRLLLEKKSRQRSRGGRPRLPDHETVKHPSHGRGKRQS